MVRKIGISALLLTVLSSLMAVAQAPVTGIETSFGFGTSARALGMGGAYVAIANGYSAPYWNPAAMIDSPAFELGFMNTNKFGLGINDTYGGGVGSLQASFSNIFSLKGAAGVAYLRSDLGDIQTFGPGGEPSGTISSVESVAIVSSAAGLRIGSVELSAARSARRYSHTIDDQSATGWGTDYGVYLDIAEVFKTGFAIANLGGTAMEWPNGASDRIAGKARGGVALQLIENSLILALQRDFVNWGYRGGLEVRPIQWLTSEFPVELPIRIGARLPDGGSPQLSFGLGVGLFRWLSINAAFVQNTTMGNSLVASFSAAF